MRPAHRDEAFVPRLAHEGHHRERRAQDSREYPQRIRAQPLLGRRFHQDIDRQGV